MGCPAPQRQPAPPAAAEHTAPLPPTCSEQNSVRRGTFDPIPAPPPPIHQQVLPTPTPLSSVCTESLICVRHCHSLPCPPLESLPCPPLPSLPAPALLITALPPGSPLQSRLLWGFLCLPVAAAYVCLFTLLFPAPRAAPGFAEMRNDALGPALVSM